MPGTSRPTALIILDGWGCSDEVRGNAIAQAHTPVFDRLIAGSPSARLRTSGADVGLPDGQFGNSEVGHINLGAGFIVDQDLTRIDRSIRDGGLSRNEALLDLMRAARARGSGLHMIGLVGQGGVHAHARHLEALLAMAAAEGPERLFVHAFTDGRDAPPTEGRSAIAALEAALVRVGGGRIASIGGRYHGMDRDGRWDRIAKAWGAIVDGEGQIAASADDALRTAYDRGVTDEFVEPTIIAPPGVAPGTGRIRPGDAVLFFNFRADRMRQLLAALSEPEFEGFERELPQDLELVTLTRYVDGQRARAAFEPIDVEWPIARVVSEAGLRQFHAAETEKYAHVTYFFNGGREAPFEGEERLLVPSPQVATYDMAPEMSARPLTDGLVERIESERDDFLVVNYANPDMVGHTGVLSAAILAVETVDTCLGRLLAAIEAKGGRAIVTADHGNCEMMIDPHTGEAHTAHTMNPVPVILFEPNHPGLRTLRSGRLADVAPTVLELTGLPAPAAMTGLSLCASPRL